MFEYDVQDFVPTRVAFKSFINKMIIKNSARPHWKTIQLTEWSTRAALSADELWIGKSFCTTETFSANADNVSGAETNTTFKLFMDT